MGSLTIALCLLLGANRQIRRSLGRRGRGPRRAAGHRGSKLRLFLLVTLWPQLEEPRPENPRIPAHSERHKKQVLKIVRAVAMVEGWLVVHGTLCSRTLLRSVLQRSQTSSDCWADFGTAVESSEKEAEKKEGEGDTKRRGEIERKEEIRRNRGKK